MSSRGACLSFIVAVAMVLSGPSGDVGSFSLERLESVAAQSRSRPAKPQPLSERLRFRATWNGVPVARAELTSEFQPRRTGGTVKLAGRAETTEALDLLWRMRDSFEATVATNPPAPSRFVLRQNENGRRRETSVTRDAKGRALLGSRQKRGRPPRTATVPLGRDVHDPASLAYLIRMVGRELRERKVYTVFIATKSYEIAVTPAGDAPIIALGRSWPARKLRLSLRLDGGADAKTPHLQEADLWVSSGRERLPLRLEGRTSWGWVAIELVGHVLGTDPDAPEPRRFDAPSAA